MSKTKTKTKAKKKNKARKSGAPAKPKKISREDFDKELTRLQVELFPHRVVRLRQREKRVGNGGLPVSSSCAMQIGSHLVFFL